MFEECSPACFTTFPRMFYDIPRNVLRHSPEYLGAFPGMFGDIPQNVWRHSPECLGTFPGMFGDIPQNITFPPFPALSAFRSPFLYSCFYTKPNIQDKVRKVKQYSKVTYLDCILDETLSGQSITTQINKVINKVNYRLRFLYQQNKFLGISLRRLLFNAMIQLFFDYACNAWYPNLNINLKTRLQAAQNKCIRFCLKLGDRKSITVKEF